MRKRSVFSSALISLAVLLLYVTEARAAEIKMEFRSDTGCNIHLSGEITHGDAENFKEVFSRFKEAEGTRPELQRRFPILCLDSPGGSLSEAVDIASFLASGIENAITYIPSGARCESACAIVFMAGSKDYYSLSHARLMHPNAKLGFHAPGLLLDGQAFTAEQIGRSYSLALETAARIFDLRRLNLFFPDSLFEEFLRTPPKSMLYVETVGQAARWNISIFPVAYADPTDPISWLNACSNNIGMQLDVEQRDYTKFDFLSVSSEYEGPTPALPEVKYEPYHMGAHTYYEIQMGEGSYCKIYINEKSSEELQFYSYGNNSTAEFSYLGVRGETGVREVFHSEFMFYGAELKLSQLPTRAASLAAQDGPTLPEHLRNLMSDASTKYAGVFSQKPVFLIQSCWIGTKSAIVTNVSEYVNLRSQPDFTATVVRQVPLGEHVRVPRPGNITIMGQERERQSCINACQSFGANSDDGNARDRVQQCIGDNMLWYEITDARGNRGWVSRKFLEEVE